MRRFACKRGSAKSEPSGAKPVVLCLRRSSIRSKSSNRSTLSFILPRDAGEERGGGIERSEAVKRLKHFEPRLSFPGSPLAHVRPVGSIAYFFALTRQTLPAPSSDTSKEPSVHTATPTGRP